MLLAENVDGLELMFEEGVRRQNQLDGDSKPQPIADTVQTAEICTP